MIRIELIMLLSLFFCHKIKSQELIKEVNEVVKTVDYDLFLSKEDKGLLILFPCFPCNAANTKTEFPIVNEAVKKGVSVLLMNFNRHLYLHENEKKILSTIVSKAIEGNKLSTNNIFIGGFSSGGNVSLLLSDYLMKMNHKIKPKGVFIVDSPIDLLNLYLVAKKNLQQEEVSEDTRQESNWIVSSLDSVFGIPEKDLTKYEQFSPYIAQTQNITNISSLRELKLRFYTEPNLKWWKEYANNTWEELNAYSIKKLVDRLKAEGVKQIEYIATVNSGFRADGRRHPHSWSIVDRKELIKWILK